MFGRLSRSSSRGTSKLLMLGRDRLASRFDPKNANLAAIGRRQPGECAMSSICRRYHPENAAQLARYDCEIERSTAGLRSARSGRPIRARA